MHIASNVIKNLKLKTFVDSNIKRWRDKFPPLIIEQCLQGAASLVTNYIETSYTGGIYVPSEVITMPRATFGPRPVIITDLPSRLLYGAMVASIEESLPQSTRAGGAWNEFQRFGLNGKEEYVVELDIASFYEYIDHERLRNEIVLRSMNLDVCSALDTYLGELLGMRRGLPQMLTASDRLADAYLSILDRKLARDGYQTFRYVDDIRIMAATWDDANMAVEKAAEYARELGLILSSKKTYIYKQNTLIDQQERDAIFFDSRIDSVREALTRIQFIGTYDEIQSVEITPEEQEAALIGAWDILMEWWEEAKRKDPQTDTSGPHQRFINQGLQILRSHEKRLPAKLLADIVFHDPRKIEQVIKYLIARADKNPEERDLRSVSLLASMGRQSPWTKLWILYAVEHLAPLTFRSRGNVYSWVLDQLSDRHEIVRAQAAWVCSLYSFLEPDMLGELYKAASPISQPALSAAATRQSDIPQRIFAAIKSDSVLNKEASKWAEPTTS